MITIICGTNRKNSISSKITKHYQQILNDKGEETFVIDLAKDLPEDFLKSALYENSGKNESFNPIREHMKKSTKYVFIVPEYNGSFPGALKLFIDGLEFPSTLKGKKCAIVGLSSGIQGGVLAMSHLTDIFNYLGMHVMAFKPKLLEINRKISDDQLIDDLYIKQLNQQAEDLIKF